MTYAYNQVPEPEQATVSTDHTLVKVTHPAAGDAWVPRMALDQMDDSWTVVESNTTTTSEPAPEQPADDVPATDEGSETV